MIQPGTVVDAVRDLLRTIHPETTALTAPAGSPSLYAVVELPPGTPHDAGTIADPEAHLVLQLRLRVVSTHRDPEVSRQAAQDLAHRLGTLLLDRSRVVATAEWMVAQRDHLSASVDMEGSSVNVVDDFELLIVPR